MFSQTVIRLLVSAFLCAVVLTVPSAIGQTTRVSISSTGAQGDGDSTHLALSADGRFVAFSSAASNLVEGDTNGVDDVFVHDRQTGQTTRVSISSTGAQGDGDSTHPAISADGRFVAFFSAASNLVEGDTNGVDDVFVHDRQTGQTTRVSISSTGAQGDGDSTHPAISADGRFVAFSSAASDLVEGDTNGVGDVFVHDRQTGTTGRVSVSSSGSQGNKHSFSPSISADGRFVAFSSYADNLVEGDWNWASDVFVHDRQAGTTERVSVSSSGNQGNGSSLVPSISADGRFVAFSSDASNLVEGDWNWASDVFVHDRQAGTTERVSVSSSGNQGNSFSLLSSLSDDGRFVAFASMASNLVDGDTNGTWDVFVRERQTGTTERISVSSSGSEGNGESLSSPSISADGRFVALSSEADNLVDGDTNDAQDVFVRDRQVIPQVSGHVRTSSGSGIASVTIQATGVGSVTTGADGHYSLSVPSGWSGTVTPNKLGYVFTPASREYSAVSSHQLGQDFVGAVSERVISGTVSMPDGTGMQGAVVSATGRGSKTTGSSGQYSFTVPNGWSGLVTPSKSGYSFTPSSRSYTNLSGDRTGQGFTGALKPPPPALDRPSPPEEDDILGDNPRAKYAVIITHGWNTTEEKFNSTWDPYVINILSTMNSSPNTDPADWYAFVIPWWWDSMFPSPSPTPGIALLYAHAHGVRLGKAIGAREPPLEHVHLIGHSAGSALVEAAAAEIRRLSPGTVIHCTFLDPYTGLVRFQQLLAKHYYGRSAHWSDAYFARSFATDLAFDSATFTSLKHAHNVDVSCLEKGSAWSRHAWPHEWYLGVAMHDLIDGRSLPNTAPGYGWYGPALSKLGGHWERRHDYAKNPYHKQVVGSECVASDGGSADPCWFHREQPKVAFADLLRSSGGDGNITAGAQTLEINANTQNGAWVSLRVTAAQPFNFIAADVEFTGAEGTQAYLGVSLGDDPAGFVDQRFRLADAKEEFFPVSTDEAGTRRPAGEYTVGFRLKRYGTGTASVRISNLRLIDSGPSAPRGDFNCDGVVDTLDFVEFMRAYAAGYPEADLTGSGDVGPVDLITFIDHFIRGEP